MVAVGLNCPGGNCLKCGTGSCGCTACENSAAPCCLRVTLAGFEEAGACHCLHCRLFNRTIDIPKSLLAPCGWYTPLCDAFGYEMCGAARFGISLLTEGGDYVLRVVIQNEPGTETYFQFEKNFGPTKPDCLSWEDLDVPFESAPTALPSTWGQCSTAAVTCTITALADTECVEASPCIPKTRSCGICIDSRPARLLLTVPSGFFTGAGCSGCSGSYVLEEVIGLNHCAYWYMFDASCPWSWVEAVFRPYILPYSGTPEIMVWFSTHSAITTFRANLPIVCSSPLRTDCWLLDGPVPLTFSGYNGHSWPCADAAEGLTVEAIP